MWDSGTLGVSLLDGFPRKSLTARVPSDQEVGAPRAWGYLCRPCWGSRCPLAPPRVPPIRKRSAYLLLNIYCFPLCSAWCQALEEGTREQETGTCAVNDHLRRAIESSQQPCSWSLSPVFAAREMRLREGRKLVPSRPASEPRSRVRCVLL